MDLNTLLPIMVEAIAIPFVNEVRNLGVTMTAHLFWRGHVMSISKKVHFALHKLKFHRNALSGKLQTTLIVFLIFPLIDYCCLVLNDVTNEMNTKLQQLVNCGIRFIFDLKRMSTFHLTGGVWVGCPSNRGDCISWVVLPSTLFKARLPPICLSSFIVMFLHSVPRVSAFLTRSLYLHVVHLLIKTPYTLQQLIFGTLFLHRLSLHLVF